MERARPQQDIQLEKGHEASVAVKSEKEDAEQLLLSEIKRNLADSEAIFFQTLSCLALSYAAQEQQEFQVCVAYVAARFECRSVLDSITTEEIQQLLTRNWVGCCPELTMFFAWVTPPISFSGRGGSFWRSLRAKAVKLALG